MYSSIGICGNVRETYSWFANTWNGNLVYLLDLVDDVIVVYSYILGRYFKIY